MIYGNAACYGRTVPKCEMNTNRLRPPSRSSTPSWLPFLLLGVVQGQNWGVGRATPLFTFFCSSATFREMLVSDRT